MFLSGENESGENESGENESGQAPIQNGLLGESGQALLVVVAAIALVALIVGSTSPLLAAKLQPLATQLTNIAVVKQAAAAAGEVGWRDAKADRQASPDASRSDAVQPSDISAGERRDDASKKAWLGLLLGDAEGGAKVSQVLPGSPAAKAGVKVGDLITAVNTHAVANAKGVVDEVQKSKPGDKIVLAIKRGDEQVKVEATAGVLKPQPDVTQSFGSRRLPPELKGLEGLPLRELFSHFVGGTFRLKDKDGKELVVNINPGTVVTATATSLTIAPNDASASREFKVSDTTVLADGPRAQAKDLKAGEKVLVITVGNSDHASIVFRVSPAYSPLDDIVPRFRLPRVWPMPERQPFQDWHQYFGKPKPQPNM